MKTKRTYQVNISATFIWIGFLLAISFMEAWLKFRAPGITIPLGLGIGKLVFRALNGTEWFFAVLILITIYRNTHNFSFNEHFPFLIAFAIVISQTFWLLPALDHQADLIIAGKNPQRPILHFLYVGCEIIKLISLFLFGTKLLKNVLK